MPAASPSTRAIGTSTSTPRRSSTSRSRPSEEQQRANYERTAELAALIRSLEPDGVTISVGGEIGEVGKSNSTEGELRAYLDGLREELGKQAPGAAGISKVSVQTGTSHGGVVLPDGTVGTAAVDFDVHRAAGRGLPERVRHCRHGPARRFHAAGRAVPQVPRRRDGRDPSRDRLPEPALRAPRVPARDAQQIGDWCFANALDERKDDQTDQQFVYTTRKKALGPFKRQLWDLESKDAILADQAKKIAFLYRELGVVDSRGMVDRYVTPVEWHRPMPASLAGAQATRA